MPTLPARYPCTVSANHLGCFPANGSALVNATVANAEPAKRFLNGGGVMGGNASLDACLSAALAAPARYFGLHSGGICALANASAYASELPTPGCTHACWGNPTQICGGGGLLSLYEVLYGECVQAIYCSSRR